GRRQLPGEPCGWSGLGMESVEGRYHFASRSLRMSSAELSQTFLRDVRIESWLFAAFHLEWQGRSMEGSLAPVYDRFLDFLVEKATPHEILAFTIPESERERALVLLDKR